MIQNPCSADARLGGSQSYSGLSEFATALRRNGMILSRGWAKMLAGPLAREVEVALPSP
ncbi:MAG: hypothetical protein KGO50_00175 [Myxococcales bacterium]|nr:hypothetical protein [Myxococcales bacterium]